MPDWRDREERMAEWDRKTVEKRLAKWGRDKCKEAYRINTEDGEGANTIGWYMNRTTNQVDAMIDTWDRHLELLYEEACI